MIELTVSIKGETAAGEDSTYRQKSLVYEDVTMNDDDPIIKECVEQALKNSTIQPDKITIRILMAVL